MILEGTIKSNKPEEDKYCIVSLVYRICKNKKTPKKPKKSNSETEVEKWLHQSEGVLGEIDRLVKGYKLSSVRSIRFTIM